MFVKSVFSVWYGSKQLYAYRSDRSACKQIQTVAYAILHNSYKRSARMPKKLHPCKNANISYASNIRMWTALFRTIDKLISRTFYKNQAVLVESHICVKKFQSIK